MGLDSVQIIVVTEQCFDIEIPDPEAEKIRTVDDLVECVWNKVKQSDTNACLTQIVFFRLRKLFCKEFNLEPSEFRLDTKLNQLADKSDLKESWNKIEGELKLKLPFLTSGFVSFKRYSIWRFDTIKDLALKILKENLDELTLEHGLTRNTVFSVIKIITNDIVGAPLDDIVRSARFVDDLGVS